MLAYLKAIWGCRYFWLSLVRMDLRTRYRRSFLGMGWSLLQPLAMTGILCLVFGFLMRENIRDFGPYVLSGLVTWSYLLGCVLQGCQCLYRGESYIRQYPAPMAIYPLRTALGGMVHFLIALLVVVGLRWAFLGFGNLPSLAFLLPSLVVLFLIGWSLAVLAGFANVFFQDTQHLCEIGFQILFYATPIIYRADMLRNSSHDFRWVADVNPVFSVLELVRQPLYKGQPPDLFTLTVAGATALVLVGAAVLTLARHERQLIFRL
jgi:ABC-type polysaccharide/polyol phosphate export permease